MTKASIVAPFKQIFAGGRWEPALMPMSADVATIEELSAFYDAGYVPTLTLDGTDANKDPVGYVLISPTGEEIYHAQVMLTTEQLEDASPEDREGYNDMIRDVTDNLFKRGLEHLKAIKQAEAEALAAQFAHDGKSA